MSEQARVQRVRFFYDKECKVEASDIMFQDPVEAGQMGQQVLFMKNIGKDTLIKINIVPQDKEVQVHVNPEQIMSGDISKITFTWTPQEIRSTPLSTMFDVHYKRVIT